MKYCLCIKLYDSFEAYIYECLDDIKTDDNGCSTITLTGKLTSTESDNTENLVLPPLEKESQALRSAMYWGQISSTLLWF